jgi:hypothetical protein
MCLFTPRSTYWKLELDQEELLLGITVHVASQNEDKWSRQLGYAVRWMLCNKGNPLKKSRLKMFIGTQY